MWGREKRGSVCDIDFYFNTMVLFGEKQGVFGKNKK